MGSCAFDTDMVYIIAAQGHYRDFSVIMFYRNSDGKEGFIVLTSHFSLLI